MFAGSEIMNSFDGSLEQKKFLMEFLQYLQQDNHTQRDVLNYRDFFRNDERFFYERLFNYLPVRGLPQDHLICQSRAKEHIKLGQELSMSFRKYIEKKSKHSVRNRKTWVGEIYITYKFIITFIWCEKGFQVRADQIVSPSLGLNNNFRQSSDGNVTSLSTASLEVFNDVNIDDQPLESKLELTIEDIENLLSKDFDIDKLIKEVYSTIDAD